MKCLFAALLPVLFLPFLAGCEEDQCIAPCGLLGIYNILSIRKNFQGSEAERKQFNKIVLRSVILAPIIVAVFVTVVVLIKLKMG